ncbi:MAG: hypothetical protein EB127_31410, partial [Alphaproteobacteria bacterium]|nr:hypothetical protein [Alphaproteobacteria bacterium]
GLTYDDVLLVPKYSEVETRSAVDLSVDLGKGIKLEIPVITANMADVTGPEMAREAARIGGLGLLHRFVTLDEQVNDFTKATHSSGDNWFNHVGCSLGVKEEDKERLDALYDAGCRIFCIDVAHGHNKNCGEMTSYVAKKYSDVLLISGNVATPEGAKYLADCGADVIKVGIGPGCFGAGTRVLMANGTYKNIEKIVPGERVINKDGNPVTVKASVCTGFRKVNKFRHTLSHKYTYVTPDHNYWIGDISSTTKKTISNVGHAKILDKQSKTTPKQSKYKWKEISELHSYSAATLMPRNINFEMKDTFEIILEKRNSGNKKENIKYKTDNILTPSYDLGYMFGTFLGDGCAI